jgi:hypothetical protein
VQYVKIWLTFREIIEPLEDNEVGSLLRMMLDYAESGLIPQKFVGNERFVWPAAKQMIDAAEAKAETLRQNGLKGGRPRSNDNQSEANESKQKQTKANESKCNQTKSNESLNVNVNVKDNVNNNIKEKRKTAERFTPPTVEQVADYCKERSNTVDPQRFIDFYASKGWKVGNQPMKDWKACVRTWEQRDDHQLKQQTKKVIAQDFPQRDYSGVNDELIDELAAEMAEFMGA